MRFNNNNKGSSLTEYALTLLTFFTASTVVIMATDVPGRLITFFENTVNGQTNGPTIEVRRLGSVILPSSLDQVLPSPAPESENVCFSSGLCVNFIPTEPGAVETTGGLGEGEVVAAANILLQVARQLAEAGADPVLVDAITRLANQGHAMADKQSEIDGLGKGESTGCTADSYDSNNNLVFACSSTSDETMNALDTGISDLQQMNTDFVSLWNTVQTELSSHATPLYQDALNVINYEATEIKEIVDGVKTSTEKNYDQNCAAEIMNQTGGNAGEANRQCSTSSTRPKTDAVSTGQSSNSICSSGGNTSTCYVETPDGQSAITPNAS